MQNYLTPREYNSFHIEKRNANQNVTKTEITEETFYPFKLYNSLQNDIIFKFEFFHLIFSGTY